MVGTTLLSILRPDKAHIHWDELITGSPRTIRISGIPILQTITFVTGDRNHGVMLHPYQESPEQIVANIRNRFPAFVNLLPERPV